MTPPPAEPGPVQPAPVEPEDVRDALAHPPEPPPVAPGELPPDKRDDILANITASYFMLRRGMAALALCFPVLLWLGGGPGELQASISAYYHAGDGRVRDLFVGVLCALGAFLILYRGYSAAEDRALDGAGVSAVLIALAPIDWPSPATGTIADMLPTRLLSTDTVHDVAAVLFFLFIAYVPLFRSEDTLRVMRDRARAARFRALYRALGAIMVVLPLAVLAVHLLLPWRAGSPWLFLAEAAAVWVFAAFWLVKSREIAVLERQSGVV